MRALLLAVLTCLICACTSDPASKPVIDEPPPTPKIGVVGLVQKQRTRAITQDNWKTALAGIVRNSENDNEASVVRVVYEVTVFYEGGQPETVTVEQDPQLKPGQRVRVTGNKIEVLPAH